MLAAAVAAIVFVTGLLVMSQVFVASGLDQLGTEIRAGDATLRVMALGQELNREMREMARERTAAGLRESAESMRSSLAQIDQLRAALATRDELLGVPGRNSAAAQAKIDATNPPYSAMVSAVAALFAAIDANPKRVPPNLATLVGAVTAKHVLFMRKVRELTQQYAAEHDASLGAFTRRQALIAFSIMLAVLGLVLFVMRPAVGVLSRDIVSEARADSEAGRELADRARRLAEVAMKDMEAQFKALFEGASLGMVLLDESGRILRTNGSLQRMLGFADDELCGQPFANWVHAGDLPADYEFQKCFLDPGTLNRVEMGARTKQGRDIWVEMQVSPVNDASGAMRLAIGMVQNVSSRHLAFRQLRYEATHDALTGLANRLYFKRELDLAFVHAQNGDRGSFAVLYIDLDHFKFINDSLGHTYGDRVLSAISERMRNSARANDIVARLGGDEFAILLPEVSDHALAVRVAERVQRELSTPLDLDGRMVYTTASIGIVYGPDGYESPDDLLRDVDTATYQAKSQGRAKHVIFDRTMHMAARDRLETSNDLRSALEAGEFRLHYQPIVEIGSGRCVGFEALIRWQHPRLGMIAPTDFITIAEETGMILPIGDWVLREACGQLRRWKDAFPEFGPLYMSINLSSQQLVQPDFDRRVGEIVSQAGLAGSDIVLEITESVIIDGGQLTTNVIEGLRDLGIRLCIDDFGTGYSSLTYLRRFKIDALKIDRSFVGGKAGALESSEIVSMLLGLGSAMNMRVIAEGVETARQAQELSALDCVYAQGYLFSKPADAASITALLVREAGTPHAIAT